MKPEIKQGIEEVFRQCAAADKAQWQGDHTQAQAIMDAVVTRLEAFGQIGTSRERTAWIEEVLG